MSSGNGQGLPPAWRGRSVGEWAEELGVPSLEIAAVLPSTNDRLRDLADEGAPVLTTVIAGAQSHGRGRSGKSWHSSSEAGLWISVLLQGDPDGIGVLPLAVGVAAARALERFSPAAVALKWPNDLLIGERKVAGILCESTGDARVGVVVGIGVNLRRPRDGVPDELVSSAGFLEEAAGTLVPEPALARALVGELSRWARPAPAALRGRLRAEWEERDALRGRRVVLETGGGGVARGVGDDGSLQIHAADGRSLSVRSGGVRLGEPGGSPALHAKASDRTSPGGV
jgi:BirA family biotin operon repressor/biotin-[acetyl-CoA-carboxylase] ligase